jgi:hypothetical protein
MNGSGTNEDNPVVLQSNKTNSIAKTNLMKQSNLNTRSSNTNIKIGMISKTNDEFPYLTKADKKELEINKAIQKKLISSR